MIEKCYDHMLGIMTPTTDPPFNIEKQIQGPQQEDE